MSLPPLPAMLNDPRMVFDEDAHRYTLDGRELISVTTALREAGMIDTTHYNEEARLRGQYVHKCIALFAEGDLDERSVDPIVLPYFSAFRAFMADTKVTLEHVEKRVCDPTLGYAGTLDAIGIWPAKQPDVKPYMVVRTLFDWKSGFFPPMAGPQTAGYLRCARDWYPPGVRIGRAGLHLRADGTYRLMPFNNIVQDEADFLAALRVAQFQRRYGLVA